ncbi:hypothetical protein [Azotosporobacter soli]|uniref:hypothetical protein n=1 Tax=Azotosporobacter soli TaxID=3055040 RepID=UPI0031FE9971
MSSCVSNSCSKEGSVFGDSASCAAAVALALDCAVEEAECQSTMRQPTAKRNKAATAMIRRLERALGLAGSGDDVSEVAATSRAA